jgi:uncharacterized RDD family membrane protein YckC
VERRRSCHRAFDGYGGPFFEARAWHHQGVNPLGRDELYIRALIDEIIIAIVAIVVVKTTRLGEFHHRPALWLTALIIFLPQLVFDFAFIAWWGRTPGMKMLGMKVTTTGDDRPLMFAALTRPAVLFGLSLVPVIGQLMVLALFVAAARDTQRRTAWDRLSGTKVVLTSSAPPTPSAMARIAGMMASNPNITPPPRR